MQFEATLRYIYRYMHKQYTESLFKYRLSIIFCRFQTPFYVLKNYSFHKESDQIINILKFPTFGLEFLIVEGKKSLYKGSLICFYHIFNIINRRK